MLLYVQSGTPPLDLNAMIGEEALGKICVAIAEAHFRHPTTRNPLVVVITGPQGCGKSTAMSRLIERLRLTYDLTTDYLSLDDYYLPWAQLGPEGRGLPGSHDTDLLLEHLRSLRNGITVNSPCYDKLARGGAGDRTQRTRTISGVALQVLLLEGWLLGYMAEPGRTRDAENAIDNATDEALDAYQPIWALVDLWCCLRVTNPCQLPAYVTRWRGQQEVAAYRERNLSPPPAEYIHSFLRRFWPAYTRYYGQQPERLRLAFPAATILIVPLEGGEADQDRLGEAPTSTSRS